MALLLLAVNLLPYAIWPAMVRAEEHSVVYNVDPAYHYDGSAFTTGQWFGSFLVGGFLLKDVKEIKISGWDQVHVTAQLPVALTNFTIPDAGVKLKTAAFCIRPSSANWPETIQVYEITPELCNDFTEISEHKINERDIDALHIAMDTLGLSRDGTHFSNEVYAAMRFICWYVGRCGWESRQQFMAGVNEVKGLFDNGLVGKDRFVSLCSKTADAIDKNIGAPGTGYTDYMPSFAGRYSSQAPAVKLQDDDGDGVYEYTYHYGGRYDSCWEYICPEGVRAEYGADFVVFRSDMVAPSGVIKGVVRQGSRLEGILPAGGILICKSDDPETQDMLIPYSKPAQLSCYASLGGFVDGERTELPSLPEVEFCRYEETFQSHYAIEGVKADAETGQKLKDTEFEILERSPSEVPQILENAWKSAVEVWDGWKRCKRTMTDEDGYFLHVDTRTYDYKGAYCKGHEQQRKVIEDYEEFISQCEAENESGGGETEYGESVRKVPESYEGLARKASESSESLARKAEKSKERGEKEGEKGEEREGERREREGDDIGDSADEEPKWDIEAMKAHLEQLREGYDRQIAACERFASDPRRHFFHRESGTEEQQTELAEDKQAAYDAFVNLEYDYTVREIRSRAGYLLHGRHPEDSPIPVVRTAAGESGRKAYVIAADQGDESLPPDYEGAAAAAVQSRKKAGSLIWADSFTGTNGLTRAVNLTRAGTAAIHVGTGTNADFDSHSHIGTDSQADFQTSPQASSQTAPKKDADSDKSSIFIPQASPGEAVKHQNFLASAAKAATPSKAREKRAFLFQSPAPVRSSGEESGYEVADWEPDWQKGTAAPTDLGPEGVVLFRWKVYDHRIEGEVHINKRDLELKAGESAGGYQSRGDTQGDATLEGAVYGLYAAQDIRHPDGKSGNVFSANELVAVAATDPYGDASFLTITEETPTSRGVKNYYDGSYTGDGELDSYPDNQTRNGGAWIGRPLLLGRYYIKEIGRSEGYERSITGYDLSLDTNYGAAGNTAAAGGSAWLQAIRAGGDAGIGGTALEIGTSDAQRGVELTLYHYPEQTRFGIARSGTAVKPDQTVTGWNDKAVYIDAEGRHVFLNETGSGRRYYRYTYDEVAQKYIRFETDQAIPLYELHRAGEVKKDLYGNPVPKMGEDGTICYTSTPESKIIRYRLRRDFSPTEVEIPGEIANTKNTANQLLKAAGYHMIVPGSSKAPWTKIQLTGTNAQEEAEAILDWYRSHPFYNAAGVQEIREEEGQKYALLRYDYVTSAIIEAVLYGEDLYVKERIPEGEGLYYYVVYEKGSYAVNEADQTVNVLAVKKVDVPLIIGESIEDHLAVQYVPEYETYSEDTKVLDADGLPVPVKERVPELAENISVSSTKTMDYLDDVARYDPEKHCFHLYIRPERLTQTERDGGFRIETEHPGFESVEVDGRVLQTGEYLKYVLGVTGTVAVPSQDWSGTYIKDILLEVDGSGRAWQDGDTREEPVCVRERVIKQKVKVVKDILTGKDGAYPDNTYAIHKDWFTENFGGLYHRLTGTRDPSAVGMDNFRFKIYLKSNLERLYRDEEGEVIWLDRDGAEVDIKTYREYFPARVQDLYTKARHQRVPLCNDSDEAVIANDVLYSYEDGRLNDVPGVGYTRILEALNQPVKDEGGTVRSLKRYNYAKFYDAVHTANKDHWDREGAADNTSAKPPAAISQANTSEWAKENARRSDAVRQFAVKWYLDDAVEKLVQKTEAGETVSANQETYSDEVHDLALYKAIEKAENYLQPFFRYDLDEIYAIAWDQEEGGGRDHDRTTVSADRMDVENTGAYAGISAYLPYGCYVIVEQQPAGAELLDFKNRHYAVDDPKEIILPSVYEEDGKTLESAYRYNSSMTGGQMVDRYGIRFQEEGSFSDSSGSDECVIKAHNRHGDFEVYKYGLGLGGIDGHFLLEQEEYKPFKNSYHLLADSTNDFYLPNKEVSAYYAYASIAEQEGSADSVLLPGKQNDADSGLFQDDVKMVRGVRTAYEGGYAEMLVPWSVTEPEEDGGEEQAFDGYAVSEFHDRFYKVKLRLEKLDSETGESILHDDAVFALYAAERDDTHAGEGHVKFYENDTLNVGSREFLEAMGADQIVPLARDGGAGELYSGMIPRGTPICKEEEQIILQDSSGMKTGRLKTFSTERDGRMAAETGTGWKEAGQNTGYLETPQPIGAGAYVLAELKPPSGYKRTRPVAVEVYSDQVVYYEDGEPDRRAAAVLFEKNAARAQYGSSAFTGADAAPEGVTAEPKDVIARLYVNNEPIVLEFSKVKPDQNMVRYRVSGRVEGSLVDLARKYGEENLEFAYNSSGKYMGYGWKKGTAENLQARKEAGQDVEFVYENSMFAGYGYVTRPRATADDRNQHVAGAVMTLYDAIPVRKSGDEEDFAYEGVKVERNQDGNVMGIQVQKGFAGETVEYVMEGKEEQTAGPASAGDGTWSVKRILRGDTQVLFYDLGNLMVTRKDRDGRVYGYDSMGHEKIAENGTSIYAIKDGKAYLEITGGDLEQLEYDPGAKAFTKMDHHTHIYHVDATGNRDAAVDPYTGMAYVPGPDAEDGQVVYVWPVKTALSATGSVIARDKVKTGRLATIHADTIREYVTGMWNSHTGQFEKRMKPILDEHGLPVYYPRSMELYAKGAPVYDRDGEFIRFRYDDLLESYNAASYLIKSRDKLEEGGKDGTEESRLYYRLGEACVMENTWVSGDRYPNDPTKKEVPMTANDPQSESGEGGQRDRLKRVYPGHYILEEIKPPPGYVKAMPQAVMAEENGGLQAVRMADDTVKVEISKVDGVDQHKFRVLEQGIPTDQVRQENKGQYTYAFIKGARLALYRAKRMPVTGEEQDPRGYRLVKDGREPYRTWVTDEAPRYIEGIPAGDYILEEVEMPQNGGYLKSSMDLLVRETDAVQNYILKDDHTKVELDKYTLDEHGKRRSLPEEHPAQLALYEAVTDDEGKIAMEGGLPKYDRDKEVTAWSTAGMEDYTMSLNLVDYEKKGLIKRLLSLVWPEEKTSGFAVEYEKMYQEYGQGFDALSWKVGRTAVRRSGKVPIWQYRGEKIYVEEGGIRWPEDMPAEDRNGFTEAMRSEPDALKLSWMKERKAELVSSHEPDHTGMIRQIWKADDGTEVRITIDPADPAVGSRNKFFYQFDYKRLKADDERYPNSVSYRTLQGSLRIDYLPVGAYVLVEKKTPEGFQTASPIAVQVTETGDVQCFSMENKLKKLEIEKIGISLKNESMEEVGMGIKGACLALYRASDTGALVQDPQHLTDQWVSEGKPHTIEGIAEGEYYLVEQEAPDGYGVIGPQLILVGAEAVSSFTANDHIKQGRVEIYKHDAQDERAALAGARFELKNTTTGEVLYITTGDDGKGYSPYMDIGETGEEGRIRLYSFSIKELVPPAFHQTDASNHEFQFDPEGRDMKISYAFDVEDEKTRVRIGKRDFEDESCVKGAHLAIYAAKMEDGVFKADGEAIENWISDGKDHLIEGKVSAGRNYLLIEEQAPEGYALSDPVVFTISEDGRGISRVTGELRVMSFDTDAGDGVAAVTITGRKASGVYYVLKDQETGKELRWSGTGMGKSLTAAGDGIVDGHIYTCTEYTAYTDGNIRRTGKQTFVMQTEEDGSVELSDRTTYGRTELMITDEEQKIIDCWTVENGEEGYIHTILNPVCGGDQEMPDEEEQDEGVLRKIFKKGCSYLLTEKTFYQDDSALETDKLLFTLDDHGNITGTALWDRAAHVMVSKQEITGARELPGAYLQIWDEDGNLVEEWETDGKPHELQTKLEPGKSYRLVEKLAPDGYGYGREILFHVEEGGGIENVTMKDRPTDVEISKVDITTQKGCEGAFLQIRDREDTLIEEWISGPGPHVVRGKLKAGETYTLSEIFPPDGYAAADKITFTVSLHGELDQVIMEDVPTEVEILKVGDKADGEGDGGLPGARLQVVDQEGTAVEEWISKTTPHLLTGKLRAGETYRVLEVCPPSGYHISEPVSFTVNMDGRITRVTMEDRPTCVEILKTDSSGNQITGAHLQVINQSGTVIEDWYSDGSPHRIRKVLNAGEAYTLRELSAPAGYCTAEEICFTVSWDGRVDQIVMEDAPLDVILAKMTEEGDYLPGASLRIMDRDGRVVDEWISKEEDHVLTGCLTEGELYCLEEIRPPDGYRKAAPIEFIARKDLKIVMTDIRIASERPAQPMMKIIKKGRSGQLLAGAAFSVFSPDGSLYRSGRTDEEGMFQFEVPPAGSYRYEEMEAPAGYYKTGQSFYFHVDGAGRVSGQLTVEDTREAVVLIEKRDRRTGEPLAGCTFRVLDGEGAIVYKGTTDDTGIEPVVIGTPGMYELLEEQAPPGYARNESVLFFKVGEGGEVFGNTVIYDDPLLVRGYKRGWVTAVYRPEPVTGRNDKVGGIRRRMGSGARTGDKMPVALLMAVCIFCSALSGWILWRKRRRK